MINGVRTIVAGNVIWCRCCCVYEAEYLDRLVVSIDLRAALRTSFPWYYPHSLSFGGTLGAFATRHLTICQLGP